MKKIVSIIVFLSLVICPEVFAEKIMNDNVSVRAGAGAFYPVLVILGIGETVRVVETRGSWKKVETAGKKTGWVALNAFEGHKKTIDYGAMAADTSGRNISRVMVTAAVKGFFKNRITDPALNTELFEKPFINYVSPENYAYFKEKTFERRWHHNRFITKNKLKDQIPFVIDEKLVAVSAFIVARLAAPGISSDFKRIRYVNNVAQLMMESSEFYDLPVSVHIVETRKIFANATPIGVIVISTGMLDTIRSESELASLLGHEIAHVTLGHGSVETALRKSKIAAEDAFAEMADELGTDDVEKELDDLSMDMYEGAIRGRSQEYEAEADLLGMIYARRAGYDASGMSALLKRLKGKISAPDDPEDSTHWISFAIEKRIQRVEIYLNEDLKPGTQYKAFEARYKLYN